MGIEVLKESILRHTIPELSRDPVWVEFISALFTNPELIALYDKIHSTPDFMEDGTTPFEAIESKYPYLTYGSEPSTLIGGSRNNWLIAASDPTNPYQTHSRREDNTSVDFLIPLKNALLISDAGEAITDPSVHTTRAIVNEKITASVPFATLTTSQGTSDISIDRGYCQVVSGPADFSIPELETAFLTINLPIAYDTTYIDADVSWYPNLIRVSEESVPAGYPIEVRYYKSTP